MSTYRSNSIATIRTIKALRGEALKIDLGKKFLGTLEAWMKRDPNDLEYRSFEIQDNRYLYLSAEKANDYVEGGEVVSVIEGKWYFDVEQSIEEEDSKTIYQGTILFQNDITGSLGQEGVPPPDNRYRTIDIVLYVAEEESLSGVAETQKDVNIEFVNKINKIEEDLQIEEDVVSNGVGDVGGISEGDTVPQGTPLTSFVKQLLQKQVPPTYTMPTAGLSIHPSGNQEVGDTISFTLTPLFNQNDGGSISQVIFKRGEITIHTQTDLTPYLDAEQVVSAGNNIYSVEISYGDGPIKNDNFGNPYPDGQILAGTASKTSSYSGVYYNWYGPFGTSQPSDGSDIRTLGGKTVSNSFTLNTGTIATVHVIAIPSTKTLQSVIDQDALNANLTSNYELSGIITSVSDAGGNPVSYYVYILALAVPYSSNHRHNITIH